MSATCTTGRQGLPSLTIAIRLVVQASAGKRKAQPNSPARVIRVWEPQPPAGVEEALEWVLLCSVPTTTVEELKQKSPSTLSYLQQALGMTDFQIQQELSSAAQGIVLQTSVAPLPQEDLARECRYELTIPNNSRRIRSVWVIFDRGRDMLRYYSDLKFVESGLDSGGNPIAQTAPPGPIPCITTTTVSPNDTVDCFLTTAGTNVAFGHFRLQYRVIEQKG